LKFNSSAPTAPANINFGFGQDCSLIANQSGADALLLVKFQRFKRSAAHIAREMAVYFAVGMLTVGLFVPQPEPWSGEMLAVAFVDGKTGDVLWRNQIPAIAVLEGPRSLVSEAFDSFPR